VITLVIVLSALLFLVVILAIGLVMLILSIRDLRTRLDEAAADLQEAEARLQPHAQRAVNSARTTHVGLITQQLAPLLPDFPYNVKDVHWIGGTIDMIVWNGLENSLKSGGEVEVVLLDVKSGRAQLTKEQRRIRDAVRDGRVRFDVYRFRPGDAALPAAGEGLQRASAEPRTGMVSAGDASGLVPLPGPSDPIPGLDDETLEDVDLGEIVIDVDGKIIDLD
jgi:predicted Holliday junction resolvase-like endonuclease